MSFVHLIIIKNSVIYNLHAHYRTAKKILEQDNGGLTRFLKGKYTDAGYIILDHDKKTIISCQTAFRIQRKKGLETIEL